MTELHHQKYLSPHSADDDKWTSLSADPQQSLAFISYKMIPEMLKREHSGHLQIERI